MSENSQSPVALRDLFKHANAQRIGLLVLVLIGFDSFSKLFRAELEELAGYWAGVFVGAVMAAAGMTVVLLILKWGWRASLAAGLCAALAVTAYKETSAALELFIHPILALIIGLIVSLSLGILLLLVTQYLFGWKAPKGSSVEAA